MRMEFTHRISDDPRTLSVRLVVPGSEFIHVIQRPTLDRFQPVPDIRKRPRHDDAHRVIDVGLLHNLAVFSLNDFLCHLFLCSFSAFHVHAGRLTHRAPRRGRAHG